MNYQPLMEEWKMCVVCIKSQLVQRCQAPTWVYEAKAKSVASPVQSVAVASPEAVEKTMSCEMPTMEMEGMLFWYKKMVQTLKNYFVIYKILTFCHLSFKKAYFAFTCRYFQSRSPSGRSYYVPVLWFPPFVLQVFANSLKKSLNL